MTFYAKGELSTNHWRVEHYVQRMDTKDWRKLLLSSADKIIVCGQSRQLIAKCIGYGVVEISKKPL